MKKSIWSTHIAVLCLMVLATACAPAPALSPTVVPPTFTQLPTDTPLPTETLVPTATSTPEPSATPVLLPDILSSTFSNLSISHRDSFEFVIENVLPAGWACDEKYAGWITKDSQFKMKPADNGAWSGTVCYFSQEIITPQKGVYFKFKFTGGQEAFTLGIDALKGNGERIKFGESGFHSVAMQMENTVVSAHILKEGWQNSNPFKGNLRLREDTWYDVAIGLDENNNYIIKIWQPETPDQQITYLRQWEDFPHSYYYISWISARRSLVIDDFTVFNFEELTQP